MALNFKRGAAAIKEAQENSGGGDFRPFVPQIGWKDGDEKYILILTPIDDIPLVDVHEFVQVGEGERKDGSKYPKYESFLDRTTYAIGEDEDPLTDKGSEAKQRNFAVAVELEPVMGSGRGSRPRPKGFEVKTVEFSRRVYDREGNDTGKKEDATAPVIGIVSQSPHNFFGYLGSYNESDGPHEDVAFRVKRRGGDKNTAYDFTGYEDQPIDLTNMVENVEGIGYLSDELDDLLDAIGKCETDEDAANLIASTVLEKRLEELADWDRYVELTDDIKEIKSRFGKKKNETTRKAKKEEPEEEASEQPEEEKPARKTRSRARPKPAAEEPEAEPDGGEPEEPSSGVADFDKLRAKAKRRRPKSDDE